MKERRDRSISVTAGPARCRCAASPYPHVHGRHRDDGLVLCAMIAPPTGKFATDDEPAREVRRHARVLAKHSGRRPTGGRP